MMARESAMTIGYLRELTADLDADVEVFFGPSDEPVPLQDTAHYDPLAQTFRVVPLTSPRGRE